MIKHIIILQHIFHAIAKQKHFLAIFLFGFCAGLPAALTASTLQAWFTEEGASLHTLGAMTLLVLPYSCRYLWAPIFDYVKLAKFDRRLSWLCLIQTLLIIALVTMACCTPQEILHLSIVSLPWLFLLGFTTALLAASYETVVNAYQVESLPTSDYGFGAAVYAAGWRIGAIISGGLALVSAAMLGWHITYLLMASCMSVGFIALYLAPRSHTAAKEIPRSMPLLLCQPIQAFLQRFGLKNIIFFIFFIATYKLGDALALALNTPFLLRHIGFDLTTLGLINKTISLGSALAGSITAGCVLRRLPLYPSLLLFGFLQGAANLSYAALAYWGKSIGLLILAAFTENFFSGMGTIALCALIMALCKDTGYTATQFALLTAIAFLPRTVAGPLAVTLVDALGWLMFFILCFVLSLPTLCFVYATKKSIQQLTIAPALTA